MYVDDVLHLHHDPDTFMNRLAELYKLKDGIVGETDRYLGDNVEEVQLDDVSVAWSMKSKEYVTNVIQNSEDTLSCDGAQLIKIFGMKVG